MLLKLRVYFTRARLLALIAAICIGSFTSYTVSTAQHTKNTYGTRVSVIRTTRQIAPGELVDADATEVVEIPATFAPIGAVSSIDEAARARHELASGAIVTSSDFGGSDASPTVAQIPLGWRAITIPADIPPPDLEPGDRCDLWVTLAPSDSDDEFLAASKPSTTTTSTTKPSASADTILDDVLPPLALQLSTNALVIDRRNDRLTVAVRDIDVEVIVAAMADASIVAVALPAS